MKMIGKILATSGKILLTVLSVISFFCLSFLFGVYYLGGLSHLYYSRGVVIDICLFFAVAILVLIALVAIIVLMFKNKHATISIVCALLLIAFIPAALLGTFFQFIRYIIMAPNGCSYTEDIANYGVYDDGESNPDYFPESITDDMTVVKFVYFYKYVDRPQTDIYLEVKFEDKETMDKYLTTAKEAFSENGFITYENPYDPKYTDMISNRGVLYSSEGSFASRIEFEESGSYKYVEMSYYSVSYSYDELTIIYNDTYIGSDIAVGNDPDNASYYPAYLERFGVEWDPDNTFKYAYVEE